MADDEKLALLKEQHAAVWNSPGWQDFRRFRADVWDPLIRRQAGQVLNPAAADFLQATNSDVDIQSPDLEKDIGDRVAYLLSNAPKIDAISLDQGSTAKGDVENIRMYAAASWLRQNRGYAISGHKYEQMVRYGVATFYKTWKMPEEPPAGEDRDTYYEQQVEKCFGWQPISPLELAWFPLSDPEVFVQESTIPYVDARRLKRKNGDRLRLTDDNTLIWVGDSEPGGEQDASNSKKVRLVKRAGLDKETGRWQVTEWVRWHGADVAKAELLDEYTCPFGHAPYFVAPSGNQQRTETNAHLRYRPMIYPLLVDIQELNALVTLLVMTAVWHIQNPFYVKLDRMRPELLQAIEGLQSAGFGAIDGAGAERKFIFRTPEPATGEVMAAPALERMPNADLPEAFLARIQQVQANIQEHRANRYLTGEAFDSTGQQPATSTLNQAQAAATPFGPYLTNGDLFAADWLQAELDAICYWDQAASKDTAKLYPIRTRGTEPIIGKAHEAGEIITVTAETLEKRKGLYELVVTTRNETDAERAMRQQLADIAYEKRAITQLQWLKERGADDPQKQSEDLWEEQMELAADAEFQPVLMTSYRNLFQALTGLNSALTQPAATGMPAEGGMPPQQPVPSGTQNGGTPLMARPEMTPPPLQGATGGSAGATY